jgi:hypothetical protein
LPAGSVSANSLEAEKMLTWWFCTAPHAKSAPRPTHQQAVQHPH